MSSSTTPGFVVVWQDETDTMGDRGWRGRRGHRGGPWSDEEVPHTGKGDTARTADATGEDLDAGGEIRISIVRYRHSDNHARKRIVVVVERLWCQS
jgi:hypothetical protein